MLARFLASLGLGETAAGSSGDAIDMPLATIAALVTAPVFLLKQLISLV